MTSGGTQVYRLCYCEKFLMDLDIFLNKVLVGQWTSKCKAMMNGNFGFEVLLMAGNGVYSIE